MLAEFHTRPQLNARVRGWIEHVFKNGPALVDKDPKTREALLKLVQDPEATTLDQAAYLPFLARELAAVDYETANITNDTDLHRADPRLAPT